MSLAKLGISKEAEAPKPKSTKSSKNPFDDDPFGAIDEMLAGASLGSGPPQLMRMGYLHKKSGGHDGKSSLKTSLLGAKWDKRFFVMPADSSEMQYYKTESDFHDRKEPLGSIDIPGATVYLKAVHKGVYRFTVRSSERELKLRADSEKEYLDWVQGLRPRVALFRELLDDEDAGAPSSRQGSTKDSARKDSTTTTAQAEGWLEKKSGSRARSVSSMVGAKKMMGSSWEKRYFVLPLGSTTLSYYQSDHEFLAGRQAAGTLECGGSSLFLKEIKGGVYRFTIRSSERELKLRSDSEAEYTRWMDALGRHATQQQGDGGDSDGEGAVELS